MLIKQQQKFRINIYLAEKKTDKTTCNNFVTPTYLHSLLGKLVDGVALLLEYLHVGLQQVFPLHALPARHGTDQHCVVDVGEPGLHVRGCCHLCWVTL